MPEIYVYDWNPDLRRRIAYSGGGTATCGFERLGPIEVKFRAEDITPEPRPTGIAIYLAQELGADANGRFPHVVLENAADAVKLPDIFTLQTRPIVSAKLRLLIEELDPIGHEFFPCEIHSVGEQLSEAPTFFHFWMRRTLNFDKLRGGTPPETDAATPQRLGFFSLFPKAALLAAQQPFWGLVTNEGRIFMSGDVFRRLQEEGLSGLERYTERGGKFDPKLGKIESVGVIRL